MFKILIRKLRQLSMLSAPLCPFPGLRMRLYRGGGLEIGKDSYLHMFVMMLVNVPEGYTVKIGERTAISPGVVLISYSGANKSNVTRFYPITGASITIEDDVWVGANAVIFPGVTLGRMSIVGAGSVVKENVAPGAVVVGAPAREVRRLPID